jgi:hypothetical protein
MELQARREQGLCYNCDDKYVKGHHCKRSFHLLIVQPEDPVDDGVALQLEASDSVDSEEDSDLIPDPAQISLHALMGHSIPQTLRVMGQINNHQVGVLIDSGSTHNFVQDRVVKQLGLTIQQAHSFNVLVGNGEQLGCTSMCSKVSLFMGSHEFLVDLYVLPLSGAELVLGVQWLKTLGPIITDYEKLTMSFSKGGTPILLSGAPKTGPQESNLHQFHRLMHTDAIDTCLQLHLITPKITPETPPTVIAPLSPLLEQFDSLFRAPTNLPPTRPIDHKINLTISKSMKSSYRSRICLPRVSFNIVPAHSLLQYS